MSVLTQVMEERASWTTRNSKSLLRMRQARLLLDYSMVLGMGVVVYMYHPQLVDMAQRFFTR